MRVSWACFRSFYQVGGKRPALLPSTSGGRLIAPVPENPTVGSLACVFLVPPNGRVQQGCRGCGS